MSGRVSAVYLCHAGCGSCVPNADLDCYNIEFKDATADIVLQR